MEADCGGCVKTTRTDNNLILSKNKKFLRSTCFHVTGNGDHVPLFRSPVVGLAELEFTHCFQSLGFRALSKYHMEGEAYSLLGLGRKFSSRAAYWWMIFQ